MRVEARQAAAMVAVVLLVCAAWGLPTLQSQQKPAQQQPAQPSGQQPQQPQPADQQQPPPPGGSLTTGTGKMKSSRQGKETATAGFNGVDPTSGKIKEDVLKSAPTADDTAKAMQLSVYAVSDADVQAFAKEGNLNLTPPAPAPTDKKKGK